LIGRLAGQISTPGRSEGAKQLARPSLLPITAAPPSSHLPQTAGGGPGLSVSCHCPLRKGGAAVMASLPCPACPDRPSARVCSGKRIKWDCSCCCRCSGRVAVAVAVDGRQPGQEGCRRQSHAGCYSCRTHLSTACPVPQTPKPPNPSPKAVCCSASPPHVSSPQLASAPGSLLAAGSPLLHTAVCWPRTLPVWAAGSCLPCVVPFAGGYRHAARLAPTATAGLRCSDCLRLRCQQRSRHGPRRALDISSARRLMGGRTCPCAAQAQACRTVPPVRCCAAALHTSM
jgi:hypothetical protein